MKRYLMLFVLVILMVKTNAQTPLSYFQSFESDNIMLIRMQNGSDSLGVDSIKRKIVADPDFYTTSKGSGGYFLLQRRTGSTIIKSAALNNYMSDPLIAYASFVFISSTDSSITGIANDILAQAKSTTNYAAVNNAASIVGLSSMYISPTDSSLYHIFLDKNGNTIQRVDSLLQTGLFEFVEPNYFFTVPNVLSGPWGRKSNSLADCGCTRPTTTNDQYMVDFSQWGLYTGVKPTEFSTTYMLPYNGANGVVEWGDINVCHAWVFQNGSVNGGTSVPVEGSGINVAVVDDGVDYKHPDLNIRMNGSSVYGYDPVNFPYVGPPVTPVKGNPIYVPTEQGCPDIAGNGSCSKPYHGTEVSGIIAAKHNNIYPSGSWQPYGMVGVAYESKLMPVHSFWRDSPCDDLSSTAATLGDGIMWAADNGADIINCSWGVASYNSGGPISGSSYVDFAIHHATTTGRNNKGSVVVFGSGNNNYYHINWPSSNTEVISVGAHSMCNERKKAGNPFNAPMTYPGGYMAQSCDQVDVWGSNYGDGLPYVDPFNNKALNTGGKLSVVAPGVRILTTTYDNSTGSNFLTPPADFDGTSSSAPYVSGVAALMLSVNPCMTPQEVKDVIELSADRITPYSYIRYPPYSYTAVSGDNNGTYNSEMGHGRVNAGNAVTLAYDIYKQNKTELLNKTYKSAHHIFAGYNETDIIDPGYYVIHSAVKVNFYAPKNNAIHLDPGFEAESGSVFLAELITDVCNNAHSHYRQAPGESSSSSTQKQVNSIVSISNLKLYPNPAKDKINLDFYLEESTNVTFTITNILGQKLQEPISANLRSGKCLQTFDIQNLPPGVYLIGFKTNQFKKELRFVKD